MINVPFGVLLFGGLDSSLVDVMASGHFNDTKTTNLWGSQLHTFSINLKVMIGLD
jgi:asparagine synthetase B (glutamine-hydrolysing)